jgi:RNA polymerase sigma-70 factor (ECF subfamily)
VVFRTQVKLADLEPFRRELTGYCYRVLGSGFEAEDAVQETLIKAWRNAERFEGRSSVRSWLYRIATNVCIDMSRQAQRRARPVDMGPASPPEESYLGPLVAEAAWVTPLPDAGAGPQTSDPAEVAQYRESVRLAFITALQHLPARQRVALILGEVLRWPSCSTPPWPESTARCSGPGPRWAISARISGRSRSTPMTGCCSNSMWTPSSGTTSNGW